MTSKASILIVEDEPMVKLHLSSCLQQMGYRVFSPVSTFDDALKIVKTHRVNLVLMDIVLESEKDGIIAAETIRRDFGVPVVFLTAYTDDKTLDRARFCQPYGYIVKPFKEEDLKSTIKMALFKSGQEKILKDHLAFNSSLLNSLEYPVLAVDCEENIMFLNSKFSILVGRPEVEIFGKTFDKVVRIFSENGEPMEIPFSRILVSGQGEQFEGIILKSLDGKERIVDIAVSPFRKEPQRIIGCVMVFRDVTDVSLSQAEKVETLEFLKRLLDPPRS